MVFDQTTRVRLQRFVTEARTLLTDEFTRQLQSVYGMNPVSGEISGLSNLSGLTPREQETAQLLRDTLSHYLVQEKSVNNKKTKKNIMYRIIREQAFTVLNRLSAIRMSESRGYLIESISKGYESKGFQLFHRVAGGSLGDTGITYRHYLFGLFDEFSQELPQLFNRFSVQARLFPSSPVIVKLLELMNSEEVSNLWLKDETIGWIYQYFNSIDERKEMRKESTSPRNSRELAVRNQFFTPRYVVEFLADNTLVKIWNEMLGGTSMLIGGCDYLLSDTEKNKSLNYSSSEAIRKRKDPRDIKLLDPACGSMHFGLYAFDLFTRIYKEAWALEIRNGIDFFSRSASFKAFTRKYSCEKDFIKDIPKLIIENNIYGVDIDFRAVQIAGLSLWLKSHDFWQNNKIATSERPRFEVSNIICADAMPGDELILNDFLSSLKSDSLKNIFKSAFSEMKLAGELGTLLRVEKNIQNLIEDCKDDPRHSIVDDMLLSLKDYVSIRDEARIAMFIKDTARGVAFIDLSMIKFDVILMNPPFGSSSLKAKKTLREQYPHWGENILVAFYFRQLELLAEGGLIGAITDRSWLKKYDYRHFREWLISSKHLNLAVDLGWGVLDDANVETVVSVLSKSESNEIVFADESNKMYDSKLISPLNFHCTFEPRYFSKLPGNAFSYEIDPEVYSWFLNNIKIEDSLVSFMGGITSGDSFRTARCHWEVDHSLIGLDSQWVYFQAGSPYSPFYYPTTMVALSELKTFKTLLSHPNARVPATDFYGREGLSYGKRTDSMYTYAMPAGGAFSWEGQAGFVDEEDSRESLYQAIAFTNSDLYINLANLVAGQHKYAGYLNTICCDVKKFPNVSSYAEEIVRLLIDLDYSNELSPRFISPNANIFFSFEGDIDEKIELAAIYMKKIHEIHEKINSAVDKHLGKSKDDSLKVSYDSFKSIYGFDFNKSFYVHNILSYCIGVIFGRWDARLIQVDQNKFKVDDPFLELPKFSPGRLLTRKGKPITFYDELNLESKNNVYPISPTFEGILVCDSSHDLDVSSMIHKVLKMAYGNTFEIDSTIFESTSSNIEKAFKSSSSFFNDHLKRYTKNRRNSPIYWPIQTKSESYTLWIYFDSLNEQTLFKCVNDFIEPKLSYLSNEIEKISGKINRDKKEELKLEELDKLSLELNEFKDEILRVAKFWKPNKSDGIQINAAPLWKLFQHKSWRKKLKNTWEKLETGDFDWTIMSYNIWPERVIRKCYEDRTLAMAHGLEEKLWEQNEVKNSRNNKVKMEWQAKPLSDSELRKYIKDKIATKSGSRGGAI